MPTLISVHNSDGCVGRCDAKCYDAQSDDCDCICGGKNHGAGLERARANTAELAGAELAAKWAESQGLDARRLQLRAQGELFPYGSEPSTAEIRANLRRARGAQAVKSREKATRRAPRVSRRALALAGELYGKAVHEADVDEGQP